VFKSWWAEMSTPRKQDFLDWPDIRGYFAMFMLFVNKGSMLDHNFLRFLPIFREKKLAFFSQKTHAMIIFLHKNKQLFGQKRQYFRQIFRRKYF
jgi:hypothetical protein